jgi:peptide/nickel transport system substrate-binding protein
MANMEELELIRYRRTVAYKRRDFLRLIAASTAVGALATLSASCATQPSPTVAPPAKPAAASGTTPAPAAKPTTAGVIRVVFSAETTQLNASEVKPADRYVARSIYEPLVDHDGFTGKRVGVLAERWELKEPVTWRFYLRKGVKFHDGADWNAAAAKASWDYITRQGSYVGSNDWAARVKETVVVDEYTFDIVLKTADPIFVNFLYQAYLASPKQIKESPDSMATKPMGTGPYKMADWQKGQFLKLTANESYWGQAPAIKDVTVLARQEGIVRANMLKTGEADVVMQLTPEESQGLPAVKSFYPPETVVIRLNPNHPQLADQRVREALSYAIDRKGLVGSVYKGYGEVATQELAPFVVGYNPDLKPWPYDTAKAKQLLKDAGYAGQELRLFQRAARFPRERELGEALQAMWGDVGIKVKLEVQEPAAFMDSLRRHLKEPDEYKPGKRATEMLMMPTGTETLDAYQMLFSNYTSTGMNSMLMFDFAGQAPDKKIADAAAISDVAARGKAFQSIMAEVEPKVFWIPILYYKLIHGVSDKVVWDPRVDDVVEFAKMSFKN